MEKPLVSIIIPIYNVGNYLRRSLQTVLNQTYHNIEILLIDDGSTDNSLNICSEYADLDDRIVVIHQDNKGVSAARNVGLEIAKGDFITFIDGDDIVAPFYIEKLMMNINRSIMARCLHEDLTVQEFEFSDCNETFSEISASECAKRLLLGRFPISVWGALFCRTNINDLRFPEGIRLSEDKYFVFCFLLRNERDSVAFTNQKMYGHCKRPGSASSMAWKSINDIVWVADNIHLQIEKEQPEWEKESRCNMLATRFGLLKTMLQKGRIDDYMYREIRNEILKVRIPFGAELQLIIEYFALKFGVYKPLVKLYYGMMSNNARNRKNEQKIKQG